MRKIIGIWTGLRPYITSLLHRKYSTVNQTNGWIAVDKFKAVTILSINRPDKQNAMNEGVLHELATQLTHFEDDESARAVVLCGIGGNFSIGYDIDELKQKCQQNTNAMRSSLFFPFRRKTTKPFLCSISGQCKSIGFEIALMCDLRFIEENAVLSFSNRKLGIPLMNDGPRRLANLIGLSRAADTILFDHEINAHDAVHMGIAVGPVKNGTALGSTMKTAVHLSSLPQMALRNDLGSLYGFNSDELNDTNRWTSIISDIQTNIDLDEKSMKSARITKLNNMAEWELEEIQHEQNYKKAQQQNQFDEVHSK